MKSLRGYFYSVCAPMAGIDINRTKAGVMPYLVRAVWDGDAREVRALLEAGADVHVQDDEALIRAALNGRADIVRVLLKYGADVHARSDGALYLGASSGDAETFRVLLEAGARVSSLDGIEKFWEEAGVNTDVMNVLNKWKARAGQKPSNPAMQAG